MRTHGTKWGTCCLIAAVLGLAGGAGDALAVAQRTFVASYGSPGNTASNCSIANPCRGFAEAISVTSPGGEVIVLDSAGYGTVAISQAISIIAPPGVYAGVSVLSGSGIVVNAGTNAVTLEGLSINGLGGVTGIDVQSVSVLRLERVTVQGFATAGVSAALTASAKLIVRHGIFVANGNGFVIATSTGVASVDIDESVFDANNVGGAFVDNAAGTVSRSSFSRNAFVGNFVQPGSASSANMNFVDCVFSGNANGFIAGGGTGTTKAQLTRADISDNTNYGIAGQNSSVTVVTDSTVTRNGTGLIFPGGGTIASFGDNRLYGNTTNGAFSGTIGKQ
jgi:hypothetical protein